MGWNSNGNLTLRCSGPLDYIGPTWGGSGSELGQAIRQFVRQMEQLVEEGHDANGVLLRDGVKTILVRTGNHCLKEANLERPIDKGRVNDLGPAQLFDLVVKAPTARGLLVKAHALDRPQRY